jgi:hypothetical protein
MLISRLFLKLLGYQCASILKKVNFIIIFKWKKKKKTTNFGGPPRKCAYQAFIIQNLDVVTLKLGMKVHFANF